MTITVNLWRSTLVISDAHQTKLQEYILNHLARCPEGKQSVSYLVQCIRTDTRISFPTGHSNAMDTFQALGFKVERGYRNSDRAWAVTL